MALYDIATRDKVRGKNKRVDDAHERLDKLKELFCESGGTTFFKMKQCGCKSAEGKEVYEPMDEQRKLIVKWVARKFKTDASAPLGWHYEGFGRRILGTRTERGWVSWDCNYSDEGKGTGY